VMLCSLMGGYWCCGGTFCFHFQGRIIIQHYINLDFV